MEGERQPTLMRGTQFLVISFVSLPNPQLSIGATATRRQDAWTTENNLTYMTRGFGNLNPVPVPGRLVPAGGPQKKDLSIIISKYDFEGCNNY